MTVTRGGGLRTPTAARPSSEAPGLHKLWFQVVTSNSVALDDDHVRAMAQAHWDSLPAMRDDDEDAE
jgi:hypothetical protein